MFSEASASEMANAEPMLAISQRAKAAIAASVMRL